MCAGRGWRSHGTFLGSWLDRRRGDADPHHIAGASASEHDSSRPGARSAPPDQAVDQK